MTPAHVGVGSDFAVMSSLAVAPATARADIIEWDVQNWAAALDFWRAHSSVDLGKCSALEIGSRHGGLSLWLALSGATVVCSDVDGPTEIAVSKHRRYGVSGRVSYATIDALDIPYADQFDLVVFKSVLGSVGRRGERDRQCRALLQMHKTLKPGGELWFAENLAASPLHRVLRRRCVSWGRRWGYPSTDDLVEYLEPFASVTLRTCGVLGAFGRSERQRAVLARLDAWVLNRIVPADWRYIAVGVARK